MKNKKLIMLTAFILVLCMMFSIFSANVYALTDGIGSIAEKDTGSAEVKEAVSEKDKLLEPIIVSEDVSKRTQYEKHFLCDDGSYIAATYMTPVHYSDGNGTWLEFDESISVSKDSMISVGNKVETVNKSDIFRYIKTDIRSVGLSRQAFQTQVQFSYPKIIFRVQKNKPRLLLLRRTCSRQKKH